MIARGLARLAGPLTLAVLLGLPGIANAADGALYPCTRSGPDVIVRQADLPPGLLTALKFDMVDPGQRFQTTDVPTFPQLPTHRLICAYPDQGGYVVEWEFGGIVHNRSRTAFRRVGDAYQPR